MSDKGKPCFKVCESCPWLVKNHGKLHPAGWYKIANLRRLWNGLRTGKAPGMICHSTDPDSAEYGSVFPIKPTSEPRECGGWLAIASEHNDELIRSTSFRQYWKKHKLPFTQQGLANIYNRFLFSRGYSVNSNAGKVGLPWEGTK